MTYSQEIRKKQSKGTNMKMITMIEFANRAFKATVVNILEDLKENMNIMMREMEDMKITQWHVQR